MTNTESNLHEKDLNLWYEKTAESIRNQNLAEIDWHNLAEEIEDMGRSEKRALDSYFQRLIEHILKLHLWIEEFDRCERGWEAEIKTFRKQIRRIIKKNPSLKNYALAEYQENFEIAKTRMSGYFEISDDFFVSINEVLKDQNFS